MVHLVPNQLSVKVTIFVGLIHLVELYLVVMVLANHTDLRSADWLGLRQRPGPYFLAILAVDQSFDCHREGFVGGSDRVGGSNVEEEEEEKGEGEEVFG